MTKPHEHQDPSIRINVNKQVINKVKASFLGFVMTKAYSITAYFNPLNMYISIRTSFNLFESLHVKPCYADLNHFKSVLLQKCNIECSWIQIGCNWFDIWVFVLMHSLILGFDAPIVIWVVGMMHPSGGSWYDAPIVIWVLGMMHPS